MATDKWVCYLIRSLDSNKTYIGSTNNFENRLTKHNTGKGAKYTRGSTWIPVLIIENFLTKRSCLSFEFQWKRLSKKRSNSRFLLCDVNCNLKYTKDTVINRILDLLFFTHNHTFTTINKYTINDKLNLPIIVSTISIINFHPCLILENFNFPFFVIINDNNQNDV